MIEIDLHHEQEAPAPRIAPPPPIPAPTPPPPVAAIGGSKYGAVISALIFAFKTLFGKSSNA